MIRLLGQDVVCSVTMSRVVVVMGSLGLSGGAIVCQKTRRKRRQRFGVRALRQIQASEVWTSPDLIEHEKLVASSIPGVLDRIFHVIDRVVDRLAGILDSFVDSFT